MPKTEEEALPRVYLPVQPPLEPMLAQLTHDLPTGGGWLYEPKWDGFRALVFWDGETPVIQSRDLRPLGVRPKSGSRKAKGGRTPINRLVLGTRSPRFVRILHLFGRVPRALFSRAGCRLA
jgi:hypothetical protein